MRVVSEPVALTLPPSVHPRSEGVHLSAIIRCIATENGILKPEWVEELSLVDVRTITDPVAILRICIGLAWESWYIPQLRNVVDHPGELQFDGIYMTPDGESVDKIWRQGQPSFWPFQPKSKRWGHALVLHEVKSTYKSMNTVGFTGQVSRRGKPLFNPLESQWMWLAQTKAYCLAMETLYCILHVLFLCGDYSYPIRPQLHRFYIEFDQLELDDNWQLMVDYRDYRLSQPLLSDWRG